MLKNDWTKKIEELERENIDLKETSFTNRKCD